MEKITNIHSGDEMVFRYIQGVNSYTQHEVLSCEESVL